MMKVENKNFWNQKLSQITESCELPIVVQNDFFEMCFKGSLASNSFMTLNQIAGNSAYNLKVLLLGLVGNLFCVFKRRQIGAIQIKTDKNDGQVIPVIFNRNDQDTFEKYIDTINSEYNFSIKNIDSLSEEYIHSNGQNDNYQNICLAPILLFVNAETEQNQTPDKDITGESSCIFRFSFKNDSIDIEISLPHFDGNKWFANSFYNFIEVTIQNLALNRKLNELYDINEIPALEKFVSKEETIVEKFEQIAEKKPSFPALTYNNKTLNYIEVNKRANILANKLISSGLPGKARVAIHMSRSINFPVVMLAILKSSGVFLPIDKDLPENRKKIMAEKASVWAVVGDDLQESWAQSIRWINFNTTDIENEDWENNPGINIDKKDPAYIIFTSGSTGNPKGVLMHHEGVLLLTEGLYQRVYRSVNDSCRVSMLSSFTFDASIQQLFPSLLLGHHLYIVPEEVRRNGKEIVHFLEKNQIEISDFTPTHLRLICLDYPKNSNLTLKHILVGGEALPPKLIKKFLGKINASPVVSNAYGPTETCVQSTSYEFRSDSVNEKEYIPIGTPMPYEGIVLLDKNNQPLLDGAIGELGIYGPGLAIGYIDEPILTSYKFINIKGTRVYKTGDLVQRVSIEGKTLLKFLGRIDRQVKIRGFRIELAEIEAKIQNVFDQYYTDDTSTINIFVTTQKDDEENTFICAYIAGKKNWDNNLVYNNLKKQLPDYMIPNYLIPVNGFSFNSSGKIDTDSLPLPQKDHITFLNNFKTKKTNNPIELKILAHWSEVLNCSKDKLEVNQNFFDVGGNSLLIIKLSRILSKAFNKNIDVVDLFKYTTISAQASILGRTKHKEPEKSNNSNTLDILQDTLNSIRMKGNGNE